LARFAEDTFRETFAHANVPQHMDLHCARSFGPARQLAEIRDPQMSTLLAECGRTLIAFGQLRQAAAPACVRGRRPSEIHRLYVGSAWQGKGIAPRLTTLLIDQAFQAGADRVWLGVWEHNTRAIAFYRKTGFLAVGEHTFMLGTDAQRDLVMEYPGRGR
jgi:ribosomal protein S18 acetylase RimI-like enzyme